MLQEQPHPNLENFSQPKIEIVSFQPVSTTIQSVRQEFFLAQVQSNKAKDANYDTIQVPKGYEICPKNNVCLPKELFEQLIKNQQTLPSPINSLPQSTNPNQILNQNSTFNPNQVPNQSIQQINQGSSAFGGVNPNSQNQFSQGGFNPNQVINQGGFGQQPNFGQPNGNQGTSLIWNIGVNGGWRF